MILQALSELYNDLAARGEIARPGWAETKIGFALCLDPCGQVTQIIPLAEEVVKGNKTAYVPKTMTLPAAVKRSSGVASNFLWDNSGYILGVDGKGKPERSRACFEACAALHRELLDGVDSVTAGAIRAFFETWDPEKCDENSALAAVKDELLQGANIVFRVNGVFAQEDADVAEAWQRYYENAEGETGQCLITGEEDVIETVHPSIKGVTGAQPSGAAIVSFNAAAFTSYGKEQGANAPIGKRAAFAYTTALNHLLADRENVQRIGDTSVVCWAKGGEKRYREFSAATIFGAAVPAELSEEDLRAAVKRLADGHACDNLGLRPETAFYILGISPNAARLSVRFFYQSTFGELMKNVNAHSARLEIVGQRYPFMSLWAMLRETVNLNAKDKAASPVLAGSVARAVFTGSLYPGALLEATMLRIRAERDITPGRAAIIKAYYLKNENPKCPKEVLQVSLNENSTNIPYTIGRLFCVYEAAQEKANPGINATIKDKYFNSVAATPAHVLPTLNNLYQKHLRKMDKGAQIYFEKQVSELLETIGDALPTHLTLPEQGSFQLGYYHQKQKRFEKKEN